MKLLNKCKKIRYWLVTVFIVSGSLLLISFDDEDFELLKNLDIYHTLMREVNLYYVDKTHPGDLVQTSIESMLRSLDPYTVYIPESKIEDYRFITTGEYAGIGANIQKFDNEIIVTNIIKDSPADNAGLKIGDVILDVDGQSFTNIKQEEIGKFLEGAPESTININISRYTTEGTEQIKKTIIRKKITVGSVPYYGMLNENTGYISLTGFTQSAANNVKKALISLIDSSMAKSIILDLRANPGGLLIEAVDIVNLFVDKGKEVVSMKGKVDEWNKTFTSRFPPVDTKIPVVVLINSRSASASEIVSGALQDLDRAVILGQRSFGKGLVQTTRDLCYNAKLKITTAKYYIPSGRCIQALDYSNRNPDGSVGKVPDSLISEFKTKAGRKVYDGGGIYPDVLIEGNQVSNITRRLVEERIIFNFATRYATQHASITEPKDFVFTEKDYTGFIHFVEEQKFEYRSPSERILEQLEKSAKEEKYFEKSADEFELLKQKLHHKIKDDLLLFKDEIAEQIREEIILRFYYQEGRIEASLAKFDDQVGKAIEILNEDGLNSYNAILNGTYKKGTHKK